MQLVGVGASGNFEDVQRFLATTEVQAMPLLWEATGNLASLNKIQGTSAMQLFSYDMARSSRTIFFTDAGQAAVLDAAVQTPWTRA